MSQHSSRSFPDRSPISHADGGQRHMLYRRDGHLWAFRWDPGDEARLIEAVGHLADTPDQTFDWVDAAVVCHCLGQTAATHIALTAPPGHERPS